MYKRFVNLSDIVVLPIANRVDIVRQDGLVKNIAIKAGIFFKVVSDRFVFKSIESRDLFRLFWIILANNFKSKFVYFADVSIMGLGYRVRLIGSSIFRLFLGKTNFIYFFATNDLLFRSFSNDATKVRKILVMGFSQMSLNNCLAAFLLLRPLNPYRVTGILDSRKFIYLKTGKRR